MFKRLVIEIEIPLPSPPQPRRCQTLQHLWLYLSPISMFPVSKSILRFPSSRPIIRSTTALRWSSRLSHRDPITVTPAACERLAHLLQAQSDAIGIRLGVRRRGCNGLSYTLNYIVGDAASSSTKKKLNKDVSMTTANGIRIDVEPMALLNVVGTEMDWQESPMASEFVFHNPNAKGECGCGESFNV